MKKSWYVFFFQIPLLPEWLMSRDDFRAVGSALRSRRTGVKNFDSVTKEDAELFKDAMAQETTLTNAINYYRQLIPFVLFRMPKLPVLQMPTLVLHGEEDKFIGKEMISGIDKYAADSKVVMLSDCSHWINQDQWQTVNNEMRQFLSEHDQ